MNNIIAGILSTRSVTASVPVSYEYFTTVLYPYAYTERLQVGTMPVDGDFWIMPNDSMNLSVDPVSGTLVITVAYTSYNNSVPEDIQVSVDPLSGTLVPVIVYTTYNNAVPENIQVSADPLSGTLITTIAYITYNNAVPENIQVSADPLSGTLT